MAQPSAKPCISLKLAERVVVVEPNDAHWHPSDSHDLAIGDVVDLAGNRDESCAGDADVQRASGRAFARGDLAGRWTFLLLRPGACDAPCDAALSGLHRRIARTTALHTTQVIVVSTEPGAVLPDLRSPVAVIRAELLPPYDVAALTATYLRMRMRR